jgi:hypothetical protein
MLDDRNDTERLVAEAETHLMAEVLHQAAVRLEELVRWDGPVVDSIYAEMGPPWGGPVANRRRADAVRMLSAFEESVVEFRARAFEAIEWVNARDGWAD